MFETFFEIQTKCLHLFYCKGHTDELWGLTVHPLKHQFLTCGYDKHICLWDSASHQPIWSKTLEVSNLHLHYSVESSHRLHISLLLLKTLSLLRL